VRALPPLAWRTALRALAGFAAGLAIYVALTPVYDRVIASMAAKTLNVFEDPNVTRLYRAPDGNVTVDRRDFDPKSKRPGIPLRDLTFNFVLLTALFAASKRPFSDRNIGGFVIASLLLAITHVLGTVTEVTSIYALKLGMWSTVHYSDFERNLWGVASHFYRLVFMYAIAFALWWVFRGPDAAPPPLRARRGRGKK
jgi:glycerol uptake facilitator-like aquaporin